MGIKMAANGMDLNEKSTYGGKPRYSKGKKKKVENRDGHTSTRERFDRKERKGLKKLIEIRYSQK